jgi:uncharacterized protein (TIGR03643 family)
MRKKLRHPKGYDDLSADARSRIIEMAWEDRTPFEAIKAQFGFDEKSVIRIMRSQLKSRSFELWRSRVTARCTKHQYKRPASVLRHHCPTQYKIRSR